MLQQHEPVLSNMFSTECCQLTQPIFVPKTFIYIDTRIPEGEKKNLISTLLPSRLSPPVCARNESFQSTKLFIIFKLSTFPTLTFHANEIPFKMSVHSNLADYSSLCPWNKNLDPFRRPLNMAHASLSMCSSCNTSTDIYFKEQRKKVIQKQNLNSAINHS